MFLATKQTFGSKIYVFLLPNLGGIKQKSTTKIIFWWQIGIFLLPNGSKYSGNFVISNFVLVIVYIFYFKVFHEYDLDEICNNYSTMFYITNIFSDLIIFCRYIKTYKFV